MALEGRGIGRTGQKGKLSYLAGHAAALVASLGALEWECPGTVLHWVDITGPLYPSWISLWT